MSQAFNRQANAAGCTECARLWEQFAKTSAELAQLVAEKQAGRGGSEALVRQAIERRQRTKQELLEHDRERHAADADCVVCEGTGKVPGAAPGDYVACHACLGYGVAQSL